ncbi:hypothetical protein [Desulfonema magnum]|uniref:hypothetical protein n=1 Tax=Desulfonema magnum TaxID=45655 RepID=UPI001A9A9ACC|nr:hypothetical protein [Desulfonema magnum]
MQPTDGRFSHIFDSRLRVGMPPTKSGREASALHSHAKRGNESAFCIGCVIFEFPYLCPNPKTQIRILKIK